MLGPDPGATGVCEIKAAGRYVDIGFGGIHFTKTDKLILFGVLDGPKPYDFIPFGGFYVANTGICIVVSCFSPDGCNCKAPPLSGPKGLPKDPRTAQMT